MQGFKDVLGTENQIQINRYLAKLPLDIAKGIADQHGYGSIHKSRNRCKRKSNIQIHFDHGGPGSYDHAKNPNYGSIDAMDPETIAKIKDPDWRNTYDMKDPKFKNIRPTEATNEAEIPEPEFQLMKKSLLRAKWYLENEEMDPEMVSSELRDVNAMLNAVEDGISDMSKVGLDTSVDEQYMSLYREAIAKLKGEKTSIYGVDNDVLPPDAKPNPESPYNSGQVEENISLEANAELQRLQDLIKY